MSKFLIISLGAMIGANLRYWVSDWAAQRFGAGFPYGTLIINLSGGLLLGFFMTLITDRCCSSQDGQEKLIAPARSG